MRPPARELALTDVAEILHVPEGLVVVVQRRLAAVRVIP